MSGQKTLTVKERDTTDKSLELKNYCCLPVVPEREFSAEINPLRAELIRDLENKWVSGTKLKYYFFNKDSEGEEVFYTDGTSKFVTWKAPSQKYLAVVREAFKAWTDLKIGVSFEEVDNIDDAEIRIGFMDGDGSWSYIGRVILGIPRDQRTMNLGWDITRPGEIDTAIHEIGHTLGFPHEHQNPFAGIVWDEEAVYKDLAKPPNKWDREKTYYNIIRKISPDSVQGSSWDPNSIMHYPFKKGMILKPEEYKNGLQPQDGLSERDKTWVRKLYPPVDPKTYADLTPFESIKLSLDKGEQKDFDIRPDSTRYYEFSTFGKSDTVMVLFEKDNGELKYMTADDDSADEKNAHIKVKLRKGREYVLRIRLYWSERKGETAVMMW